jgi:hypothetical protein
MQKAGRPWYRKGKDAWYVWHDGRQVHLARGKENKAEVFARFAELLAGPNPETEEARFTHRCIGQRVREVGCGPGEVEHTDRISVCPEAVRQELLDRYRRSADPSVGHCAHILLFLDAGPSP